MLNIVHKKLKISGNHSSDNKQYRFHKAIAL